MTNPVSFSDLISIIEDSKYCTYKEIGIILDRHFNKISLPEKYKTNYLKEIIKNYINNYTENLSKLKLPESIIILIENEFNRIDLYLEEKCLEYYSTNNDFFLKDFGISAFKLIPVGSELADLSSGVPRSILFKGGVAQFFTASYYFIFKFKGFKPFLQLHLDPRNLNEFTPEGWEKTYFRLAEFLELNPEYKGFYGASWFYDPALDRISPHLSYLRTIREAGGAKLFRWGAEDDVKGMALEKSSARREHYRKGQYRPCSYFIVWGRRELISWAEKGGNI